MGIEHQTEPEGDKLQSGSEADKIELDVWSERLTSEEFLAAARAETEKKLQANAWYGFTLD